LSYRNTLDLSSTNSQKQNPDQDILVSGWVLARETELETGLLTRLELQEHIAANKQCPVSLHFGTSGCTLALPNWYPMNFGS